MVGEAIRLNVDQARVLLKQFHETVRYRGWWLWAAAIMADHFHAVVGVRGDPEPSKIRADLKTYGSRRLNKLWGKPVNGTWWTARGSNRKLPNEAAVLSAICYTVEQEFPLIVWTCPVPELDLPGGELVRPRPQHPDT